MPDDDSMLGQNEVDVRNEARNPMNSLPLHVRRYHLPPRETRRPTKPPPNPEKPVLETGPDVVLPGRTGNAAPPGPVSSAVESEPRLTPVGWPDPDASRPRGATTSGSSGLAALSGGRKRTLFERIVRWMGDHPIERAGMPW